MDDKKIKYGKLLLTTEDSKLVTWDNGEIIEHFQEKEIGGAMGLIIDKDGIYLNTPTKLYWLNKDNYNIIKSVTIKGNPQYHHMNVYGGYIYVSATFINEIHVFKKNLTLVKRIKINPPQPKDPVKYKINYNHINTIIKNKNRFYVNLNWFNKQYGSSGIAVFDGNWKEINRYKYGWESHDLQFFEDGIIVICATSNPDKKVNHKLKSGILLNGKLVFEHNYREAFCKGLTWDNDYLYLCGGMKANKGDRKNTKGIIYIIDRKSFDLVEKITNFGVSNIKGCRLIK